jgi:catechol 2,3-dioxygenase-like lactoylglutathione lyase family enzyme
VRVALGWSGGLNIELIQPVAGHLDHYLPFLPADKGDPVPRFHHIAVRRDDLDAMRDEMDRLGLPLAFESDVPGMVFVYLDARESLGHYFEYVWATPEGWDMIGWPRDRPVF